MKPTITIIIPLYKTKLHHILPLMGSYSNQYFLEKTLTELLFLYDDTVEQEVLNFIKKVLQDLSYFKLTFIKSENTASGYKRNLGIQKAEGDYVWFNDQDDWLVNQASLIALIKFVKEHPKDHYLIEPNYTVDTPPVAGRPWMHVVKKELAQKFRFLEDKEWGADEYYFTELFNYKKVPYDPSINHYLVNWDLRNIYHWNNISIDSYSVTHKFQKEFKELFSGFI